MANRLVIGLIAIVYFFISFLILLDQERNIGVWFQVNDVLHHETFAIIFFVFGIGILVGAAIAQSRK